MEAEDPAEAARLEEVLVECRRRRCLPHKVLKEQACQRQQVRPALTQQGLHQLMANEERREERLRQLASPSDSRSSSSSEEEEETASATSTTGEREEEDEDFLRALFSAS